MRRSPSGPAHQGDLIEARFWYISLGPGRRLACRARLYGEAIGLRIRHEHDGALWLRHHKLHVTGRRGDVRRFTRALNRLLAVRRGRGALRPGRDNPAAAFLESLRAPTKPPLRGGRRPRRNGGQS